MSGAKLYWEKYRERKKSPCGAEVIEGMITNCNNDRFSELQGQINILEDRVVNLSRQFKMQMKGDAYEMIETVGHINKIDKILEIKQMFDEKTSNIEKIVGDFAHGDWEEKVEKMIERAEKRMVLLIEKKTKALEEKIFDVGGQIEKFESEITKKFKKYLLEAKFEETLNKKLDDFKAKLNRISRSQSPDNIKKKIEDLSTVQEKLQKIVIATAEKVKKSRNSTPEPQKAPSKFSNAIEKISDLLKKYSKAQEVLFSKFDTLEEKTRVLEEKFENSRSFAISEPIEMHKAGSFSSIDENFRISFGSEEGHPKCSKVQAKAKAKKLYK